jgi:hypothetical protein
VEFGYVDTGGALEWTDMSGTSPLGFNLDPLQILGFGFIGLAFLMAILAYRSLKEVIAAPNPRENVIKLARLFMYLSLALLIAAGPLQLGLLWAQSAFVPKPVMLKVAMVNSTWDPKKDGIIEVRFEGQPYELAPRAIPLTVKDGSSLDLQLEQVARKIEEMRAAIVVVTNQLNAERAKRIGIVGNADEAAFAVEGG